ncbi:MAG: LuxR C-terminal-related transcriptional regulator [Phycisphaeraceae bacterium]
MRKSYQLRNRDVRNIYRLLGDCRDLGADPLAWRRRLLDGLIRLLGARVAHIGDLQGMASRSLTTPDMMQIGLEAPTQTAAFEAYFQFLANGGAGQEAFAQRFGELPPDRLNTRTTSQLMERDAWHRSMTFQRFHQPMDVDEGILSLWPLSTRNPRHGLSVSVRRSVGEPAFTERERRMLHWTNHELARELGRTLAPTSEPAASELPRRLGQTLGHLLDGLSEKQIALEMGISRATVHEYVTTLYRRFAVDSRAALLARWVRYGNGASHRPSTGERPACRWGPSL